MALFDLPLEKLQQYRPPRDEPADFDDFWRRTLADNDAELDVRVTRAPRLSPLIAGYDLQFAGYGGHPVSGWLLIPERPLPAAPTVVQYMGYNGGRGFPHQWWTYPAAGFPTLVVEARGQGGSGGSPGATADPVGGTGSEVGGFLTRGIESPDTYYLRRVYVDAVRSIDVAMSNGVHDATRVVIAAGSQGGGIGLAVAGLRDVELALLDVPSLCHFRRATQISNSGSRAEIAGYLATHRDQMEPVFRVLSYFDGLNFAARAQSPARFSVGLMDQICPPSTVFAAYHHYRGEKSIQVWPYNGHEGGGAYQVDANLRLLAERFG